VDLDWCLRWYVFTLEPPFFQEFTAWFSLSGHLGDATVEHVAHHLPIIIRDFLLEAFANDSSRLVTPAFITDLFSRSIVAFDNAIARDVLDLFGGIEGLSNLSDETIRRTINDQHYGGANYHKVRLCMHGTTALVALVDPEHNNLWIANLGDCRARTLLHLIPFPMFLTEFLVMVSADGDSDDWRVELLTTDHNGDNDAEIVRVRHEHPEEPECVVDRRVLGALAPFRSSSFHFLMFNSHC